MEVFRVQILIFIFFLCALESCDDMFISEFRCVSSHLFMFDSYLSLQIFEF